MSEKIKKIFEEIEKELSTLDRLSRATDMDDTGRRFMYSVGADTFEFQAYAYDDKFLKKGNYKQGEMLTDFDDWDNGSDNEERIYIPCGDDFAAIEECIEESDNDQNTNFLRISSISL